MVSSRISGSLTDLTVYTRRSVDFGKPEQPLELRNPRLVLGKGLLINMLDDTEIPETNAQSAFDAIENHNGVVLDVRERHELEQISVAGAIHIPLGDLHLRLDEVPRDKDVYLLCHVGQRSAMATGFLRQIGHDRAWNIGGGIIAWVKAGLPVEWPGRG